MDMIIIMPRGSMTIINSIGSVFSFSLRGFVMKKFSINIFMLKPLNFGLFLPTKLLPG